MSFTDDTTISTLPAAGLGDATLIDTAGDTVATALWTRGLEPEPRPLDAHPHSAVTAVIIVLFTAVALASRHLRQISRFMATDMLGVRRRNNVFDTHTSAESRTIIILILLATLSEAILLDSPDRGIASSLRLTASLAALTTGYYLFQLSAYYVVGYTFADTEAASQWCRGFNLSQALLGIVLLPLALVDIFYSSISGAVLVAAAIVYVIVRVLFIYKGFRIFYNSIGSLVYFILYLCTLEIIPPIAVYSASRALNRLY